MSQVPGTRYQITGIAGRPITQLANHHREFLTNRKTTMKYVSITALLIAGIIHLLPIPGVLGAANLGRLYGITVSDPNTAILLQHRALLFGVLGVMMLLAIPLPFLRVTALLVGLASAVSFIAVALWVGNYGAEINRVVIADVIAVVLLAAGLASEIFIRSAHK